MVSQDRPAVSQNLLLRCSVESRVFRCKLINRTSSQTLKKTLYSVYSIANEARGATGVCHCKWHFCLQ